MQVQSVTETVAKYIRLEIITGKLAAGARLNELELSERFGVSRPPIREAFRKLENENLVVSVPRKGSYVTTMSLGDCEEIYHVRLLLERSAIDIIGKQKIEDLSAVKEALAKGNCFLQPEESSPEEIFDDFDLMAGFHNKLVESCRNRWIIHYHAQLRSNLARYQILYLKIPGSRRKSLKEHEMIFSLLEKKDFPSAKKGNQPAYSPDP